MSHPGNCYTIIRCSKSFRYVIFRLKFRFSGRPITAQKKRLLWRHAADAWWTLTPRPMGVRCVADFWRLLAAA